MQCFFCSLLGWGGLAKGGTEIHLEVNEVFLTLASLPHEDALFLDTLFSPSGACYKSLIAYPFEARFKYMYICFSAVELIVKLHERISGAQFLD